MNIYFERQSIVCICSLVIVLLECGLESARGLQFFKKRKENDNNLYTICFFLFSMYIDSSLFPAIKTASQTRHEYRQQDYGCKMSSESLVNSARFC